MGDSSVSGILIVHKPEGITSFDVVARLRRLFGTRQVGHTGTLDPMATGVLPVLIGRAVKASDFILAENKRYTAALKLGLTTDTEDVTGTVLTRSDRIPSEGDVRAAVAAFVGDIEQIPPMYSALKVNGQKLVDLARQGITVEREPRSIRIDSIDVSPLTEDTYRLDVRCSKGTYIRTLCADIGARLGCGGVMASLVRTESGPFTLAQSVTLPELEAMSEAERAARLLPLDRFFADCPALSLSPFFARLASNGQALYQKKIGTDFAEGTLVRMYRPTDEGEEFFALGRSETGESSVIRPVKLFIL